MADTTPTKKSKRKDSQPETPSPGPLLVLSPAHEVDKTESSSKAGQQATDLTPPATPSYARKASYAEVVAGIRSFPTPSPISCSVTPAAGVGASQVVTDNTATGPVKESLFISTEATTPLSSAQGQDAQLSPPVYTQPEVSQTGEDEPVPACDGPHTPESSAGTESSALPSGGSATALGPQQDSGLTPLLNPGQHLASVQADTPGSSGATGPHGQLESGTPGSSSKDAQSVMQKNYGSLSTQPVPPPIRQLPSTQTITGARPTSAPSLFATPALAAAGHRTRQQVPVSQRFASQPSAVPQNLRMTSLVRRAEQLASEREQETATRVLDQGNILARLFNNPVGSDQQIICKGHRWYLHRRILQEASLEFSEMIISRSSSVKGTNVVMLSDFDPGMLESGLAFMYNKRYDNSEIKEYRPLDSSWILKNVAMFVAGVATRQNELLEYASSRIDAGITSLVARLRVLDMNVGDKMILDFEHFLRRALILMYDQPGQRTQKGLNEHNVHTEAFLPLRLAMTRLVNAIMPFLTKSNAFNVVWRNEWFGGKDSISWWTAQDIAYFDARGQLGPEGSWLNREAPLPDWTKEDEKVLKVRCELALKEKEEKQAQMAKDMEKDEDASSSAAPTLVASTEADEVSKQNEEANGNGSGSGNGKAKKKNKQKKKGPKNPVEANNDSHVGSSIRKKDKDTSSSVTSTNTVSTDALAEDNEDVKVAEEVDDKGKSKSKSRKKKKGPKNPAEPSKSSTEKKD